MAKFAAKVQRKRIKQLTAKIHELETVNSTKSLQLTQQNQLIAALEGLGLEQDKAATSSSPPSSVPITTFCPMVGMKKENEVGVASTESPLSMEESAGENHRGKPLDTRLDENTKKLNDYLTLLPEIPSQLAKKTDESMPDETGERPEEVHVLVKAPGRAASRTHKVI